MAIAAIGAVWLFVHLKDQLDWHVEEEPGFARLMRGEYVETISPADGGTVTGLYYDWAAAVAVFRPDAKRAVLLGVGGGQMLRVLRASLPEAELLGVEIEPRVAMLARVRFGLQERVVVDDAARWVRSAATSSYDAVLIDVFDGDNLPQAFRGSDFFSHVERMLTARGMALMNVYPASLAKEISSSMRAAGLRDVVAFPMDESGGNVVLWAVRDDDWGELRFPAYLHDSLVRRYTP